MSKGAIKVREVRSPGRPVRSFRQMQTVAPQPEAGGSLVEEYLLTLKRHRALLLLAALAGVLLGLLSGVLTLPVYQTRTSLDIRSLNGDFLNMRSVAPTGENTPAEADTNLQTQIRLLQSDTLLAATMKHMLAEPHPANLDREDSISRLRRALHLGHPAPISYQDALADAAQHLKVKPLGLTRLVELSCTSWSPQLAAAFCNDLITTYQEQDLQVRSSEATTVSGWLTRQVADIRQRAQQTQAQLEAAVGGNGLRLSQANTSIGEERLQALQGEVVKAQADRIAKEAAADEDRSAAPGTQPDVLDSPAHRAYAARLEDLQGKISALEPPLTEENPKIKQLRSQIHDAEAGLQATETTTVTRSHNELDAARHREQLLTLTYNAQLANVSADLQQSAKVSLLRSELDSEQQLYQTLLQRAREAGFASAMQASTIRVIDPAQVPRFAAAPRRSTEAAVGLLLGGIFGVVLAFYRERTQNVFRMPGEILRMLDVQELGVIPANTTQMRLIGSSAGSKGPLRIDANGTTEPEAQSTLVSQWDEKFSLAAEAYSNATFSILQAEAGRASRAYAVSSPKVGEGKTTITSNLGVALSKAKLRVLLIDGDLRRPSLHKAFGLSRSAGLRDVLRGKMEGSAEQLTKAGILHETAFPNLSVIPAGSGEEDSVQLLNSERLPELLGTLARSFDVVLIDTPPALHMVDTRIIARACDGLILVVRASVTTLDEAANARDLFDRDGVHLVGTILNDFDPHAQGFRRYYKAYEQYQKPHAGSGKAVNAA